MNKPEITNESISPLYETKYIKLFDIKYKDKTNKERHYFDASRREQANLIATKSTTEFKSMSADAAVCFVILNVENEEPKLLFSYEFRYPVGQFILNPVAGLMDKEDAQKENPLLLTAKRELLEETGIVFDENTDKAETVSPLVFSSPGLTDECNSLVLIVLNRKSAPALSSEGCVGSECFNGFELLTKEAAKKILKEGVDKNGIYYSIYTWASLIYFVSDMWK